MSFPGSSAGKESICNAGDLGPWAEKIPWRRKWQPTPVILPGESHGQRNRQATVYRMAKGQTNLSN